MERLAASLKELGIEEESLVPLVETSGGGSGAPGGLWRVTAPGERALWMWEHLRERVEETGHWPVLLGDEGEVEMILEVLEYELDGAAQHSEGQGTLPGFEAVARPKRSTPTVDDVLRAGAELDRLVWLDERASARQRYGAEPHRDWPDVPAPQEHFTIPRSLGSGRPLQDVVIAFAPTTRSWEVAAHMRWGGWNDCPKPEAHVAMHKYWHDRYGAEVVGMSHDVVEMRVARPPTTRDDALSLARDQYAYCSDIVHQGVETIERLAAALLNSRVWYFWWD